MSDEVEHSTHALQIMGRDVVKKVFDYDVNPIIIQYPPARQGYTEVDERSYFSPDATNEF